MYTQVGEPCKYYSVAEGEALLPLRKYYGLGLQLHRRLMPEKYQNNAYPLSGIGSINAILGFNEFSILKTQFD